MSTIQTQEAKVKILEVTDQRVVAILHAVLEDGNTTLTYKVKEKEGKQVIELYAEGMDPVLARLMELMEMAKQ